MTAFGPLQSSSARLNGKWIIDTGCNHHVTGDLTYLTDLSNITSCSVGLPDGQDVVSSKEGTVKLTDKIILQHVLYVPKLDCNLISVSQLSDDLNCEVITNSDLCAIQDRHTRKVIGTGDSKDGLYYLRG